MLYDGQDTNDEEDSEANGKVGTPGMWEMVRRLGSQGGWGGRVA
jgi:hypothetical protein